MLDKISKNFMTCCQYASTNLIQSYTEQEDNLIHCSLFPKPITKTNNVMNTVFKDFQNILAHTGNCS